MLLIDEERRFSGLPLAGGGLTETDIDTGIGREREELLLTDGRLNRSETAAD
jgi:hypothetical protein